MTANWIIDVTNKNLKKIKKRNTIFLCEYFSEIIVDDLLGHFGAAMNSFSGRAVGCLDLFFEALLYLSAA